MKQSLAMVVLVLVVFAAGWWIGRSGSPGGGAVSPSSAEAPTEEELVELFEHVRAQSGWIEELARRVRDHEKRLAEIDSRLPDFSAGAAHTPAPVEISIERSPSLGAEDAVVTIVEFSDFACPHCASLSKRLRRAVSEWPRDVRLVFKHFPLETHPHALGAHKAALAAGAQGRFWELHERLFEHQDRLDAASLEEHARAIGLNLEQFRDDLDSKEITLAIAADVAEGRMLRIDRVPTVFINGRLVAGARSWEFFEVEIAAEIRRLRGER